MSAAEAALPAHVLSAHVVHTQSNRAVCLKACQFPALQDDAAASVEFSGFPRFAASVAYKFDVSPGCCSAARLESFRHSGSFWL